MYAVGLDILEPLFSFPNLVSVVLSHPVGFDLDDTAIVAMARAWPQIQYLHLEAGPSRHIPSRVTLVGLRAFAQHCPRLRTLYLTFDASVIPKIKHDVSQTTLEYLNVALSPINNPQRVAEFLFAVFPSLKIIGTLHDDIVEELEELDLEVIVEPHIAASHSVWKSAQESLLRVREG